MFDFLHIPICRFPSPPPPEGPRRAGGLVLARVRLELVEGLLLYVVPRLFGEGGSVALELTGSQSATNMLSFPFGLP